jgi:hypothetical protein
MKDYVIKLDLVLRKRRECSSHEIRKKGEERRWHALYIPCMIEVKKILVKIGCQKDI